MKTVARIAGVFVLWTILSSTLFVLLGGLWNAFPPPSMFWQWWHYAMFSDHSMPTMRLLGISAIPPAIIFALGFLRLLSLKRASVPALYGVTEWPTDEQAKSAGFRFTKR